MKTTTIRCDNCRAKITSEILTVTLVIPSGILIEKGWPRDAARDGETKDLCPQCFGAVEDGLRIARHTETKWIP